MVTHFLSYKLACSTFLQSFFYLLLYNKQKYSQSYYRKGMGIILKFEQVLGFSSWSTCQACH